MKILKVLLISIFFFLSGCSNLPDPVLETEKPHIKFITYNINWGGRNRLNVVKFLQENDVDIVALQETHTGWEKLLKHHLRKQYKYSIFAEGLAFLSKYKIKKAELIEYEEGWFPALLVKIESNIGTIQVLNLHLRPPLGDDGLFSLSALFKISGIHKQEIRQVFQKLENDIPGIIAGDFNEDENGGGVKSLLDKGYSDALSLFDKYSDTWYWPLFWGLKLTGRYDHILFSKDFKCLGAKVSNVNASDHMPLLAVLALEEKVK